MISVIFGAVVLILLMSSEFTWRTARQNVIDGLSKTEWFWGKVTLLPIVGAIFILSQIGIGAGFAFAGTDPGATREAILGAPFFQALGGFFLAFFVLGSLASTAALAIRSSHRESRSSRWRRRWVDSTFSASSDVTCSSTVCSRTSGTLTSTR